MFVIGKDPQGRIWFKSDQCLSDITDAQDFYVQKVGWWNKEWQLVAVFIKRAAYFRDNVNQRAYVPALTEEKVLGTYKKESAASLALEELMRLRGIKELDPLKD